jgi:hypothetical protein
MAAAAIRRADFMIALAYATDLATGQSRQPVWSPRGDRLIFTRRATL